MTDIAEMFELGELKTMLELKQLNLNIKEALGFVILTDSHGMNYAYVIQTLAFKPEQYLYRPLIKYKLER